MRDGSVDATCARCGHPAEGGVLRSGHSPWGCDVRQCRCHGFLTKAQADALKFLRAMERERGHRGYQEEKLGDAARLVLEAFE